MRLSRSFAPLLVAVALLAGLPYEAVPHARVEATTSGTARALRRHLPHPDHRLQGDRVLPQPLRGHRPRTSAHRVRPLVGPRQRRRLGRGRTRADRTAHRPLLEGSPLRVGQPPEADDLRPARERITRRLPGGGRRVARADRLDERRVVHVRLGGSAPRPRRRAASPAAPRPGPRTSPSCTSLWDAATTAMCRLASAVTNASASPDAQASSRRPRSASSCLRSRSVRRRAASSAAPDSSVDRSSAMCRGSASANRRCITPASSLVATTYVPEPWRMSSSPLCARARTASRTVFRATPSCSTSSGSVGMREPTGHSPEVIWFRSCGDDLLGQGRSPGGQGMAQAAASGTIFGQRGR